MQNADELVVAARGDISIASVGTTLPTNLGPLDAAFVVLGYTSEDGVTFSYSENREDIMAWQKATAVRRIVTARGLSTGYELEQWNRDTFALAFGGGSWSEPSPGIFRYDPPDDDDALAEYCQVIDFHDGDRHSRVVIEKGGVTEDVETNLVRTGPSLLPVTFGALASDEDTGPPWYFLGDDPAFQETS